MSLLVGVAASLLLVATYGRRGGWTRLRRRTRADWLLDGSGLALQGIVVPWLQTTILVVLLQQAAPTWRGSVSLSPWLAFAISFVGVDYAYYWNHRLLHGSRLWRWHVVHHTAAEMNVLVTSRNTVWSHFLILYVWVNALGIFLLSDATGFVLGAALTAALDLWRHSEIRVGATGWPGTALRRLLITPAEHAWHHSAALTECNFGANLSWWDRVHGTYLDPAGLPRRLGVPLGWTPLQQLVFPSRTA